MSSEEVKPATSLRDRFNEVSERAMALIAERSAPGDRTRDCANAVKKLEDLLLTVHDSNMYSAFYNEDEGLDDVATRDLPILKTSAYLGLLLINGTGDDRLECLDRAIFYMRQYLAILKKLGIFDDPDVDDLLADSAEENRGYQRRHGDLLDAVRDREKRVKRFKDESLLKSRLERANILQALESNEEELRDIYLDELRLYGFRVVEELNLAKQEYQILRSRPKPSYKPNVPDEAATASPSGGLKMFFIPRDGMKKNVFGAGYPSVPTQSIDDWLKRRELKEKREVESSDGAVVESFKPGAHKKAVTFTEESKSNSSPDSDDESKLASEREWDEYKDTHPRGWGNTYNKG